VRFVRNDRLSLSHKAHVSSTWVNIPFTGALRRDKPDIIILNRGAHYSPDATLRKEMLFLLRSLRHNHRRALIVVRTTPPGAPECGDARTPAASLEAAGLEDRRQSSGGLPRPLHLPFHWGDFARQNAMLAEMVTTRFHPHAVIMDVYLSTALRPDARRVRSKRGRPDCLHLREPSSALDDWVRRLANIVALHDVMYSRAQPRRAASSAVGKCEHPDTHAVIPPTMQTLLSSR